jgi:hypothetical protein
LRRFALATFLAVGEGDADGVVLAVVGHKNAPLLDLRGS